MPSLRRLLEGYAHVLRVRNALLLTLYLETEAFILAFAAWYIPMLTYRLGGAELVAAVRTLLAAIAIPLPVLSGLLSDRLGRVKVLSLSYALILAFIALLLASYRLELAALLVTALVLGRLGVQLRNPVVSAMFMDSVPEDAIGRVVSAVTVTTLAVSSAGSMALGLLMKAVGPGALLLSTLAVYTLLGITLLFMEETAAPRQSSAGRGPSLKERFTALVAVRGLGLPAALFLAYMFIDSLTGSVCSPYFVPFLVDVQGADEVTLALIYSILPLGEAAVNLVSGPLVDRYNPASVLVLQTLISSFSILLFATAWPPLSYIFYIISSASSGLFNMGAIKLQAMLTTRESRATFIGACSTLQAIARLIGPGIGLLLWRLNPRLSFIASSASSLLLVTPLLLTLNGKLSREASQD
ncbi:MAG: hypothetical protein DRJ67_06560 [Thermoprotei archaeon]|nr:MAG: hypothetical protein DRJ67_06560 [Thermoprotei archaeon]